MSRFFFHFCCYETKSNCVLNQTKKYESSNEQFSIHFHLKFHRINNYWTSKKILFCFEKKIHNENEN